MATSTQAFTSTGTWKCPVGVTAVKVEIRAPGGGSGGMTTNSFGQGGGAGGQYVIKNAFSVTPGTTYTVTIGAVGAAGSATGPTAGGTGGDTWFSSNDASGVVGKGGAGSSGNSGTGASGSTAGGVGDTVYAGGNGGTEERVTQEVAVARAEEVTQQEELEGTELVQPLVLQELEGMAEMEEAEQLLV
jgi:hypothetical protein